MAKQVKTYRVLRDGMLVGDSVRNFGDLMPEAASFPNLRSYLNSHVIEEIWVDQSVIDDFYKELEKTTQAVEVKEDDEGDENPEVVEVDPEDKEPENNSQPKKKVAKKTVKKKTTRKKAEPNGKQLEERSV